MSLDDLKKEKDKYVTRIFWLGLQIALIFGIPAALAAYFGLKLDRIYESGRNITFALLAGAFVLSWIITIVLYRRIDKKIKEIDLKIKDYNRP